MAKRKPVRPRIHPYLPPELLARFDEYVAARGMTESAVVAEALEQLLGGTGARDVLYRRLDNMTRAMEGLDVRTELGELRQHVIALEHLVRALTSVWLANTAEVPKEQRRDQKSVTAAYERLWAAFTKSVASGRTVLDDLPRGARDALAAQVLAEPVEHESG